MWKWIFRGHSLYSLVTSEIIAPWLWPLLIAIGIALTNFISPVPIPFLIAAMATGFGGVAIGIKAIGELRSANAIEGKLVIVKSLTEFGFRETDQKKAKRFLETVRLGFEFASRAEFPILFRVDEIYSDFANKVPSRKPLDDQEIEISPKGMGFHKDTAIQVSQDVGNGLEGNLRISVSYWRKGHRKVSKLERAAEFRLFVDANGQVMVDHNDR